MDAKLSKSEICSTWRFGHCKMWAFIGVLYNWAHMKRDLGFQVSFVSVGMCHSLSLDSPGTYLVPKTEWWAWTLAFFLCDVKLKGLAPQTWFKEQTETNMIFTYCRRFQYLRLKSHLFLWCNSTGFNGIGAGCIWCNTFTWSPSTQQRRSLCVEGCTQSVCHLVATILNTDSNLNQYVIILNSGMC